MEIAEIYSHTLLTKISWKQRFSKEVILMNWFHEIFFMWERILCFYTFLEIFTKISWKQRFTRKISIELISRNVIGWTTQCDTFANLLSRTKIFRETILLFLAKEPCKDGYFQDNALNFQKCILTFNWRLDFNRKLCIL